MTELEKKIAAKIPGEDTGIEVKQTFCSICSPAFHCGVDAYIKDGKVIKVEGTAGHPLNHGLLCTKGCNNRSYIYREDRIMTPLKRVGERGEGKFEPISWDEAYDIIAENLLRIRKEHGANAVAFYGGYQKWFRWMFSRFAFDFGSVNYGTESSCCFTSSYMAWKTMTGTMARPDMANSALFIAWGSGNHHARHLPTVGMEAFHARGGKLIVIDPRNTPLATRSADLHLRIRPGTDGLLANCIAGIIIRNGWQKQEYIDKYVHGFEEYKNFVLTIDVNEVSKICDVSVEQIEKMAQMIHEAPSMCMECNSTPIIHQSNGYQTVRAMLAISAITGNYDVLGGNCPNPMTFAHQGAGFPTHEEEYEEEKMPEDRSMRVGGDKYPVWCALENEMQSTDLARQILEGTPYEIRGMLSLGMNFRIFPNSDAMEAAIKKLDFYATADLFLTDTAKLADIVLPACSSFEREEIKVYGGGFAKYYTPVIAPLGESRSDDRILRDLANKMDFDDELIRGSLRENFEYAFKDTGFDLDALIANPLPTKQPGLKPYVPLAYLNKGVKTKTGKLEIYSEIIAEVGKEKGLDPLPKWYAPFIQPNEEYPFVLMTGIRQPMLIHSVLHDVGWARSLRPDPMADISMEDAKEYGLVTGDDIEIYNDLGSIRVKANVTGMMHKGQLAMYHGYREADVNNLVHDSFNDPYSGFPGFKSDHCAIRKV